MNLDMHCHIDLYKNHYGVIEQIKKKGLYVLSVTTTPKAYLGTKKLVGDYNKIKTALGFHPELAHLRYDEVDIFDLLLPQVKYVGEIGLDGSAAYKQYANVQLDLFKHIIRKVHSHGGRVMSIHSRLSAQYVINELRNIDGLPVFHWFTGTKDELRDAINLGAWFSVGPAMLKSRSGREILALIPKDRLLTETDGPFGKFNGEILFPWDVDKAIELIANCWEWEIKDTKLKIMDNFKELVRLNNSSGNQMIE